MILKFATKRDVNGNRKYLAIDFQYKQFSRNPAKWFCREDVTEISSSDYNRIKEQLANEQHFTEIDSL